MAVNINKLIEIKGNINAGVREALKDINKNFVVTMIDSDDLEPSEDNFYKPRNIEKIKESIESFGIQQNLIVMKKENGKYEILAGERRYRGNKMLIDEGKKEFNLLPCRIIPKVSDTLKNIIIILTNSEARDKSPWEVTEEVARLKILYEDYKKENPGFKGRVRELSAKELKMSPANIGRHVKINKKLIKQLKDEYKNENIGFTAANEIASLPQEKQEQVLEKIQKGEKATKAIREVKEEETKEDLSKLEQEGQTTINDHIEATNESGTYKPEFTRETKVDIPPKYGTLIIKIAHDPNDRKYRAGYNYTGNNYGSGYLPNINNRPYNTEQQAFNSMISKLQSNSDEATKQGIIEAGYATDKPNVEVRNIQITDTKADDQYSQAAAKILIDLLKKELETAERDIQKSADKEEVKYITAYVEKIKRHLEIEQGDNKK